MKQFVYLALLGLLSNEAVEAISFRPNGKQSPWSAKAPDAPSGIVKTGYQPADKGAIFYNRVIPSNFSQDSDDKLMRSLISKYAIEGRTDDLPNGTFVLSKHQAKKAAKEVVGTHFGWTGKQRDDYVKKQFAEKWPMQDQIGQGWIAVAKGPVLLKSIIGEVEMNNKLQVQLEDEVDNQEAPLSEMNVQFRPNSYQSPWSAKAKDGPSGIVATGYNPRDKGAIFYNRVIPSNFSQDSDDKLMRSLISKYAIEGRTDDLPNGNFVLSKAGAWKAAQEVVGTHFGWTGEKRDNYVEKQFAEKWPMQDQIGQGWIAVAKGPVLLKSIIGEVELNNKLQVQLEEDMDVPENNLNIEIRPNPALQPWAKKATKGPTGKTVGAYKASDSGNSYYDRVLPDNFSGDTDDLFMRSVIKTYSVEGKTDGKPNGQFYLERSGAEGVAKEIVGTHFGWKGAKRDKFVKSKLKQLWGNYDVLNEGWVDVQKAPTMMRTLLGEVEIGNKLQMQTQEDLRLDADEEQYQEFRPNKIQQPWSYKGPAGPTGTIVGAFKVGDKSTSFYDRQIPANYAGKDDDLLMRSLITNYTLEGNTDGKPNGKFYLTKKGAESVAREVVGSHFGWKGDKRNQYVKQRLGEFWPNHDVLNEGFIDASKGAILMKSILGEVEINNKLQVQTVEDLNLQNGAEVNYRPDEIQSPWAQKDITKQKPDAIAGGFRKHSIGNVYYNRSIPGNFENSAEFGDSDRLMNSLIGEYSIEGKDQKTGLPNGRFFIDKMNAEHVAEEVVKTHLGMDQKAANAYVEKDFPAVWDHADILKRGFIETEAAPMMVRAVVGEVEAQGGLQ